MINDNTIISSFNDRPTLLEWLKKVEEALKTDTAKSISVDNPETNVYVIKITFADGSIMQTEPVKLPDSVKGVSISNNHLIITTQGGISEDLGVINPYADAIVLNSETNTTEIANNLQVNGNVQLGQQLNVNGVSIFNGHVNFSGGEINVEDNIYLSDSYSLDFSLGGNITDYGGNSGIDSPNKFLGTNEDGHIVYKEVSGGTPLYLHKVKKNDGNTISFLSTFDESLKTSSKTGNFPALVLTCSNVDSFKFTTTFSSAPISGYYFINYDADGAGYNTYDLNQTNVEKDSVLRFL